VGCPPGPEQRQAWSGRVRPDHAIDGRCPPCTRQFAPLFPLSLPQKPMHRTRVGGFGPKLLKTLVSVLGLEPRTYWSKVGAYPNGVVRHTRKRRARRTPQPIIATHMVSLRFVCGRHKPQSVACLRNQSAGPQPLPWTAESPSSQHSWAQTQPKFPYLASIANKVVGYKSLYSLVGVQGFEPWTYSLRVSC
jgi:hypothetical protein